MTALLSKSLHAIYEKIATQGIIFLSDAELLIVLEASSCLQSSYDLLNHFGDLRALFNANSNQITQIPGFEQKHHWQLQAARELCRRSDFISLRKQTQLTNSKATYQFLKRQLRDHKHETFAALFLDSQYRVIAFEELFHGTINSAQIHPRPIIERALAFNAAALIAAHNHPSGLADASPDDFQATKRLQQALALVDVELLEHVVVGDNEVFSIMHQVKTRCH